MVSSRFSSEIIFPESPFVDEIVIEHYRFFDLPDFSLSLPSSGTSSISSTSDPASDDESLYFDEGLDEALNEES